MAAHEKSLEISDRYRALAAQIGHQASAIATTDWAMLDLANIDASHARWTSKVTAALQALQAAGVRLTAAYLTAFLQSELGHPAQLTNINERAYIGVSRSGKPLDETLAGTAITVKQGIAVGLTPREASQRGRDRAARLAAAETIASARGALSEVIRTHPHIVGWRRVTHSGCGACVAAASGGFSKHEPFPVHDGCQCTAEPVIDGAPDRFPRPDGRALFDQMTVTEQDQLLGGPKAELIRSGQVPLEALIAVNPMTAIPDQITEAPLSALQAQAA